jgi:hypothetical protein
LPDKVRAKKPGTPGKKDLFVIPECHAMNSCRQERMSSDPLFE